MKFDITSQQTLLETIPFKVEKVTFETEKGPSAHPFHRITCSDWVNVLPVTADGKAVLIRQPRVGNMKYTLETPGGTLDPGEKDPTLAAARELEEETGYVSQRILSLASINPNPAMMTNRLHLFVALGCIPAPQRKHFPDVSEEISLELVPTTELEGLVRFGRIDHALVALCIMLAGKYVPIDL